MMQITEDTPPDMLAGAMDLSVHLPNNIAVKMSVERSTPMMDLLVQITTANHLQLSNYTLQALGWAPSSEHSDKILPFKPNTPIGALDTQHIRVIPKEKSLPPPKYKAPGHQPFESTFRLKVHLPRNQLYVTRVSRNVLLEDIMKKVCEEKNLDPTKYEFKRPGNLDEALDPKLTLSDYQITEIYVVSKGTTNLNQAFSTADIMVLRKEEERKQMHNKTGGGVFNLIFKRGKSSMGSGSVSSDNRSVSPTHSDDSRSVTPPTVQAPPIVPPPPTKDPPPDKSKPPQRKRRPAPKPPQIQIAEPSNEEEIEKAPSVVSNEAVPKPSSRKTIENGLTICHSRNSSDSSGYHEASILSDHNASLPRNRPKSAFVSDSMAHQSTSNLTKMAVHSKSTTSLVTGRKKKAAPPPPPSTISPANSVVTQSEKPSPLVASQPDISTHTSESLESSNLTPAETLLDSIPPCPVETSTPIRTTSGQEEKTLDSTDSGIAQEAHLDKEKDFEETFGFHTPPPPPILDDLKPVDQNNLESNISQEEQKPESLPGNLIENSKKTESTNDINPVIATPSPILEKPKPLEPETELVDIDWQYQLPSPPKAFRDSSPVNVNANEVTSVSDFKDSVVTSPELFEKLHPLEDNNSEKDTLKSEITSVASEEPLNTLSLEHLEKRKSLVYNRELATSLKMTDSLEASSNRTDTFVSSPPNHRLSYGGSETSNKSNSQPSKPVRTTSHHTLPNFKITTYDVPKQNIKVFEDDTIRSNTHNAFNSTKFTSSKEPETFSKRPSIDDTIKEKEREYKFYRPQSTTRTSVARSGSFSTDDRLSFKPVSRSKSTLTLNKYQVQGKNNENNNMSRSNSLFDVSGLQSLEVMKLIQNKLSTPTSSLENVNAPSNKVPPVPHQIPEPETPKITHQGQIEEKSEPQSPKPVKKYYYRGPPPAVNMSTWSERPKVPVAVKEDEDYKLGNANVSSKLIVTTTNNNVKSTEITSNVFRKNEVNTNKNNGVHVNGTDQITQSSGNVIIKIGGTQSTIYHKNLENQRYLGPTGYKKSFPTSTPRPHSIALPSDFDISRVPVVKAVELKKPFRDIQESNTSITHINHSGDGFSSLHHNLEKRDNNSMSKFRSTENLSSDRRLLRINSFKPVADDHTAPVVKGFKQDSQRSSWTNFSYNTLPAKPKVDKDYTPNQHVPFSQATLRRTHSRKIYEADKDIIEAPQIRNSETNLYSSLPPATTQQVKVESKSTVPPPPPPQMPLRKVKPIEHKTRESPTDARDMLLESIRNFGGKKGLRASKA